MPRSCWGVTPRRSKASLIPSWQRWSSVLRISMRRTNGGAVEPWESVWRDIQGGCAVRQFSGFFCGNPWNVQCFSRLQHLLGSLSLVMAFLGIRKLSFWRFGTYWCSLFSRRLWLCETTVQQKIFSSRFVLFLNCFFLSMFISPYHTIPLSMGWGKHLLVTPLHLGVNTHGFPVSFPFFKFIENMNPYEKTDSPGSMS
jgi:hypothetical protein